MSVVVAADASELEAYFAPWNDLAANALEPNVFYEPWMLMPALRSFGAKANLSFVLVFSGTAGARQGSELCGFFPLERRRRYRGLPLGALTLWKHLYCYLCTPLVRAGFERECMEAFFDWLEAEGSAPLLDLGSLCGDGPVYRALAATLQARSARTFLTAAHERALFRPAPDGDTFLRAAMSRTHRKDVARRRRRLAELGAIEYATLAPDGDISAWLDDFLRLEASGWKGRKQTALASTAAGREFFAAAATAAFRQGRLMMLALKLNGAAIALKCNFSAAQGAFAFKIAFDESYAHYSPGLLLEIENIYRLHEEGSVEWMDSCAAANHFMINRLWPERRIIHTLLVSTGGRSGNLVVSLLPKLRRLKVRLQVTGEQNRL